MIDLNLNPSRRELKWFSAGLIVFAAIIAWMVYRKWESVPVATAIASTGAVLGIVGLIVPAVARWIYIPWVLAAFPIGWTISHILLGAVFYLAVTPLGLLMRLLGRDPMQRAFDRSAKSYWIARPENRDGNRYFRQF